MYRLKRALAFMAVLGLLMAVLGINSGNVVHADSAAVTPTPTQVSGSGNGVDGDGGGDHTGG